MRLTRIAVENHSRLANLELKVCQYMVLVGPNDVGKSSLLRCLHLLLGASTAQLYSQIGIEDFRDREKPFLVEADIAGFDGDEHDLFRALFPDEIKVDGKSWSLTIRLEASFDSSETLSVNRYAPHGRTGRQLSREQLQAIGWRVLGATDGLRNLQENRRSLLNDLLNTIDLGDEEESFKELNKQVIVHLHDSTVLSGLREKLSDQLTRALPEKIDTDQLQFAPGSSIGDDMLDGVQLQVLKDGKPHLVTDQSDGMRAMYAVAMYDLISGAANMVAIDEPEIHLHPTSQRSLASLLKNGKNQKILATHSPDIVGAFRPEYIVSVRPGGKVMQLKKGLLTESDLMTLRWWRHNKLEPLTARHIIAVEGIADRIILEQVASLTNKNLDRLGVSVIEVGGAGEMGPIFKLFGNEGFNIPIYLLIDKDATGKTAKSLKITEDELEKHNVAVSEKDLEDEYVRAIGAKRLYSALRNSHKLKKTLDESIDPQDPDSLTNERIAEFCRSKRRKVAASIIAAETMDKAAASRVESISKILGWLEDR